MKKRRRIQSVLAALALMLGLAWPMPASAVSLYFTGINDSVTPLTSDTMPCWFGGTLYVPYTVFDAGMNGVNFSLGLSSIYNRFGQTVSVFNLKQILVFELDTGVCRDDMTGVTYNARSIMRHGRPYLPLNTVCSFFGLEYSYTQLSYIPQGFLVRVRSADAVLDDARFVDGARNLINSRLREYTQSLSPAESTDVGNTTPSVTPQPPSPQPPEEDGTSAAVYLAFRCESGEALRDILNGLDGGRCYAVFFLSPQVLEEEGDLIRRMLGSGHSVGILADSGEELGDLLTRGSRALEEAARTRTTLAYVPAGQREALEQKGWVCWEETALLTPRDTVSPAAFASSGVSRLGSGRGTVYLTVEGNGNTARVLSALLRQLDNNNYKITVPMETRL